MWQEIVVGIMVVAAVLALLWRWMPQRWRKQLGAGSSSGCGGCSACDSGCSRSSPASPSDASPPSKL